MICITKSQFLKLKGKEMVPVICDFCGRDFIKSKYLIKNSKRPMQGSNVSLWSWNQGPKDTCSKECLHASQKNGSFEKCRECEAEIYVRDVLAKQNKNRFCSHTCAATFNNKHKTYGTEYFFINE